MKIVTSKVFISVLGFMLIIGGATVFIVSYRNGLAAVGAELQNNERGIFDNLFYNNSAELRAFVQENVGWDPLVNLLKQPKVQTEGFSSTEIAAQEEVIKIAFTQYGIDGVWVFTNDGRQLYGLLNDSGIYKSPNFYLPTEQIPKLFQEDVYSYFFLNTPDGVLEIYGGQIKQLGSNEILGYLFAARKMGTPAMADLSQVTKKDVRLGALGEKASSVYPDGQITFIHDLNDPYGKKVASLIVTAASEPLVQMYRQANILFALILLVGLLVVVSVTIIVIIQSNARTQAENMVIKTMEQLKSLNTDLERRVDDRTQELQLEVEEHRKTEESLRAQSEELRQTMNVMTGRELEMTRLKEELRKLKEEKPNL